MPTLTGPLPALLDAMEKSLPIITAAGWESGWVNEIGNAYISAARAIMTTKALDAGADVVVYLDHDMAWAPRDLLTLIETPGDVVAGTYRYKDEPEDYMGVPIIGDDGRPVTRSDGCIKMRCIPAGFMKITKAGIERFKDAYPHLKFGRHIGKDYIDLFNHGAYEGVWYGEDYAFSRNWIAAGGDIWVIPHLQLDHHTKDKCYPGNYHDYWLRQPGGSRYKEAA